MGTAHDLTRNHLSKSRTRESRVDSHNGPIAKQQSKGMGDIGRAFLTAIIPVVLVVEEYVPRGSDSISSSNATHHRARTAAAGAAGRVYHPAGDRAAG